MNPCNDPANEGGALRSQDIRTMPTGGGGGASYAATVLADAPVGYWRLGEASGTSAADEIGAHNGTYVGSPTLGVTGIPGSAGNTAMTLNGSGSGVRHDVLDRCSRSSGVGRGVDPARRLRLHD